MNAEKPPEKLPPAYRTLTPPAAPKPPAKPAVTKPPSAPSPGLSKPAQPSKKPSEEARPDPTRFGDWEVKGRCIDF